MEHVNWNGTSGWYARVLHVEVVVAREVRVKNDLLNAVDLRIEQNVLQTLTAVTDQQKVNNSDLDAVIAREHWSGKSYTLYKLHVLELSQRKIYNTYGRFLKNNIYL